MDMREGKCGRERERDKDGSWNRQMSRWLCPAESGNRGDTTLRVPLRMTYMQEHTQSLPFPCGICDYIFDK